jgi:peptidoglycan/xylan/chitin deacetylase (PgdA/CDA1 family)
MAASALTCCITFDFDAMSLWIASGRGPNPSTVSRGQFGAVAIPRILDLLDRYRVTASFAVPGHTALAFPRVVARIAERGHEILHHGWVHENPAALDEANERRVLELGTAALERVTGSRPVGYRSPGWSLSERSVELLLQHGFLYDSSCMGDDTQAYYLRTGDHAEKDAAFVFGQTTPLVELPVSWSLDDFPVSEYVPGQLEGLRAPSAIEEMWRGDFDYAAANSANGIFNLTLHPQVIGRGNRMLMLERLLVHIDDRGARFETLRGFATRWKAANPLDAWKASHPDLTGELALSSPR